MPAKREHTMGSGGNCICPKCGFKKPHERGVPCQEERCPHCNVRLFREGSAHHQQLEQKKSKLEPES